MTNDQTTYCAKCFRTSDVIDMSKCPFCNFNCNSNEQKIKEFEEKYGGFELCGIESQTEFLLFALHQKDLEKEEALMKQKFELTAWCWKEITKAQIEQKVELRKKLERKISDYELMDKTINYHYEIGVLNEIILFLK